MYVYIAICNLQANHIPNLKCHTSNIKLKMSAPKPVTVARLAAFKGHVTRAIRTCEE